MTFHTALGLAPINYTGVTSHGIVYAYTLRDSAWGPLADVAVITSTDRIPVGEIKVPAHGHGDRVKAWMEDSHPAHVRRWTGKA